MRISDDVRNQVVELRKNGAKYDEIVEKLGIGKGTVSAICKEAGLTKVCIALTPEKIEECQKLYDEIGNIKLVAKQTGISYNRLREVIKSKTITPKSSYDCVKEHRRKIKEELVKYKGGKCEKCGYDKCIAALEFHHLNPLEKDFGIASSSVYKNLKALKLEVDKCMLVCANCHRELHYEER